MLEVLEDELSVGSVVAGAYQLERVVGKGGMGVVWAAREVSSGRAVALKFLLDPSASERTRERFLREARAAMSASHTNIARVEAVLETAVGMPFLVMELLEGESLRQHLRRRGALPAADAARLLVPVVDAVAAAHAQRIIHRDLKPENVYLARDGRVLVLDFGIAKQLPKNDETAPASLTSTGALIGTPVYMAPEQIFGDQDVDERADVWSLGIILYECLAARRPTDGDGFGPIIRRITTDPLEPIDRARPGVPRRLAQLVMRMLSRTRNERPSLREAREVLAAVVEAGDAAPTIEAPPATVRLPPSTPSGTASPTASPTATAAPPTASPTATTAPPTAAMAPPVHAPPQHLGPPAAFTPPPQTALRKQDALERPAFVLLAVGAGFAVLAAVGAIAWTFQRDVLRSESGYTVPDGAVQISLDRTQQEDEARAALRRRDAPACLAALTKFDEANKKLVDMNWEDKLKPSTDPSGPMAEIRAKCLMLAGHCKDGADLLGQSLRAHAAPKVDETVTSALVDQCEGSDVTPSIDVRRAVARMKSASNMGAATSRQQCATWYALVKKAALSDPKLAPDAAGGDDAAASCFANAGACADAKAVVRDSMKGKTELEIENHYLAVSILTPCAKQR